MVIPVYKKKWGRVVKCSPPPPPTFGSIRVSFNSYKLITTNARRFGAAVAESTALLFLLLYLYLLLFLLMFSPSIFLL